jgi:hypothetical protein
MNDTTAGSSAPAQNEQPLARNEYVQELFSILKDNGCDATGLAALLIHVGAMENFVKRAEDKIAEMKSQLAEMKEIQNHPVKTALSNAIKALEHKVAEVRERIGELKAKVIKGCKNAVTAFKEKGAAALNNLARFFRVKSVLTAIGKDASEEIRISNTAIDRINEYSKQYHTAGRAVKNIGRMFVGKEPIDDVKRAGMIAKTLIAPHKVSIAISKGIQKSANKAVAALDGMEERQTVKKSERSDDEKSARNVPADFMVKLAGHRERAEREKLDLPAPERVKAKGAEL